MENDNPNQMSNEDLEKDMLKGNQENVKKTTAAEGDLIAPEEDQNQKSNIGSKERDLDEMSHQDGSLPDPDELSLDEEEGYDNADKFSG